MYTKYSILIILLITNVSFAQFEISKGDFAVYESESNIQSKLLIKNITKRGSSKFKVHLQRFLILDNVRMTLFKTISELKTLNCKVLAIKTDAIFYINKNKIDLNAIDYFKGRIDKNLLDGFKFEINLVSEIVGIVSSS